MINGGICGMPTDTVYVLVAACNRPDAVIKAYKSAHYYFVCIVYSDGYMHSMFPVAPLSNDCIGCT